MSDAYGLYDARGCKHLLGCVMALYMLGNEGKVTLATPKRDLSKSRGTRLLEAAEPAAEDVPADLRQTRDLEIVPVENGAYRVVWNTLMDREHPWGTTTLAGAQLR